MNLHLSTRKKGLLNTWLGNFYLRKNVSAKTWRVFASAEMFYRKRDAFYLLQLCFIENVTRYCCYMFVLPKTWRVFAVTRFFGQNVARFSFHNIFSSKTWRVFTVTSLFRRKRAAFLLLQVCSNENVASFTRYRDQKMLFGIFYWFSTEK